MRSNESFEHFAKVALHVVFTQHVIITLKPKMFAALSRICRYVAVPFLSSDFQFSFTVDATHNIRLISHIDVTTLSVIFLSFF